MAAVVESKPVVPVGRIKNFGPFGPKYEVREPIRPIGDGDWLIAIRLVETGELTEYRLSRLLQDPEAA